VLTTPCPLLEDKEPAIKRYTPLLIFKEGIKGWF
jgi:hypothetical protein